MLNYLCWILCNCNPFIWSPIACRVLVVYAALSPQDEHTLCQPCLWCQFACNSPVAADYFIAVMCSPNREGGYREGSSRFKSDAEITEKERLARWDFPLMKRVHSVAHSYLMRMSASISRCAWFRWARAPLSCGLKLVITSYAKPEWSIGLLNLELISWAWENPL